MHHDGFSNTLNEANDVYVPRAADDCVSGRGEEVRLRALKLYVVRSTAEKHGGTMKIDLAADTVSVNVPKEEMAACTEEIAKQLESLCCEAE